MLIKTGMAAWTAVTHRREGREIDAEVWRREREGQWAESKVPTFLKLPFL